MLEKYQDAVNLLNELLSEKNKDKEIEDIKEILEDLEKDN